MSSGKKRKKKNPHSGAAQSPVRLSQCMIVKNEEKNIERALSWAKDIAFEQIVVDTGSTDRTVEIAESMGAKIYHFEWIDDFAAAKNYAIEQASGNWIAFLDADEYFTPEDTERLMVILNRIQSKPEYRKTQIAINCPWIQLDNANKPFAVLMQERIFRKLPDLRYEGRIHEKINAKREYITTINDIGIMHTGYSDDSFKETGKSERNLRLLRAEIEKRPDDQNLKVYLADALVGRDQNPEDIEEARRLYLDVIYGPPTVYLILKKLAYRHFHKNLFKDDSLPLEKLEEINNKAVSDFPENIDFLYHRAVILINKGNYDAAQKVLAQCEDLLGREDVLDLSVDIVSCPLLLYYQMAVAAQGLGDDQNVVKYSTLVLREDKTQKGVLTPYIATMLKNNVSEDELISLLQKLYDFSSVKDKLFIARAAKDAGAVGFAKRILDLITDEERRFMSGGANK